MADFKKTLKFDSRFKKTKGLESMTALKFKQLPISVIIFSVTIQEDIFKNLFLKTE